LHLNQAVLSPKGDQRSGDWSDKGQHFQLNELETFTSSKWRQNCVIFVAAI